MDCCLSYNNPSLSQSSPSPVKIPFTPPIFNNSIAYNRRRFTVTLPSNRIPVLIASSISSSHCEFSSLNTPLEPKSPAGKYLSGVLQNDRKNFHYAVAKQLEQLVSDRDEALARASFSFGTTDACLYRFSP